MTWIRPELHDSGRDATIRNPARQSNLVSRVQERSAPQSAAATINYLPLVGPADRHESETNRHVSLFFAASTRTPVLQV
ncbi:MAG: hypothetical protein ACHQQS_05755 [Thermoanaerobaculales bacterium]